MTIFTKKNYRFAYYLLIKSNHYKLIDENSIISEYINNLRENFSLLSEINYL